MWASYSIQMWWPLLLFSVALCSDIMSWSWIAWYGLDGQWCREKPIQNLWDPKFVGATLFMWTFWTLRTLQNRALHPAFSAVLQMNTLVLRTTDQRLILSVLLFWTTTANTGFCSTGLFFWRSLQVSWVLGRCPRKESLGLLVRNFLQAGCPLRHPTNCFSALDLSSFQQELIIFIN